MAFLSAMCGCSVRQVPTADAAGPSPSQLVSLQTASPPSFDIAECGGGVTTFGPTDVLRAPPVLADYASAVPNVLIATVVQTGPGQWSIPDGRQPDLATREAINFHIYRPITVAVETSVKGDAEGNLVANLWGGSAGCVRYDPGWVLPATMADGSRWALLLDYSPDGPNGEMTNDLMIIEAWPVTAAGVVKTPLDGDLSLTAFESAVSAAGDAP